MGSDGLLSLEIRTQLSDMERKASIKSVTLIEAAFPRRLAKLNT